MAEILWMFLLVFALVVWPVWMIRRIHYVRAEMSAKTREGRESFKPGFIDAIRNVDGLVYARSGDINEELIDADKQATAMPDIVKTLEGRR